MSLHCVVCDFIYSKIARVPVVVGLNFVYITLHRCVKSSGAYPVFIFYIYKNVFNCSLCPMLNHCSISSINCIDVYLLHFNIVLISLFCSLAIWPLVQNIYYIVGLNSKYGFMIKLYIFIAVNVDFFLVLRKKQFSSNFFLHVQ